MSSQALRNKVIAIIGGTAGLGLSAAKACIASGGRVVVAGRDPADVLRAGQTLGTAGRALVGDATHADTAQQVIAEAVQHFGRLDGLYHVAGGSGRSHGDGPLHEITDEGWELTLRHNLTSLFYSSRAAVGQFLQQGTGGSVLVMGSVLGYSPSPRYFATHAYAAAKSAAIGFTKSAAAYYAGHDIRFNLIAPALVETPMSGRAIGDEAIRQYIAAKQPLDGGRVGQPEDLDAAVVYFLSDDSRYVTGQVLAVDGGWSVSEPESEVTP